MADPKPRVQVAVPGGRVVDVTGAYSALKWTTAAVGGFGSATLSLDGDWRRRLPMLSMLRVSFGPDVLFEGRIEDLELAISDSEKQTNVTALGLQRRLEQTSVRRIWVKRDMTLAATTIGAGAVLYPGSGFTAVSADVAGSISGIIGSYDPSDPTKIGVRFNGNTGMAANGGQAVDLILPGVTLTALLGTAATDNTNFSMWAGSSNGGTTWEAVNNLHLGTAFVHVLAANADRIRIAQVSGPGGITGNSDFFNLRILGATTAEDQTGGLYGGTILRDLLKLVPELTVGTVEDGSEFAIEQIDRYVRDSALSVLQELSSYYTREWGVWEDGRFDWKQPNLDEVQWTIRTSEIKTAQILESVDSIVRTVFIEYADAIALVNSETSQSSNDQKNPFVKVGQTKDAVVQVPFLMTSNTASRLATVLAQIQGSYPQGSGTLVLDAVRLVRRPTGAPMPAFLLRGGDNILVSDLPKTDPFQVGRDGETLFHIVGTEADTAEGHVTLEIEAADKRSDVLMARLSAATRAITG